MSSSWVQRVDVGRLRKAEKLGAGGVRVPAAVSRVGILEYTQPDGSVVRELVPPDELGSPESLATLRDAVVTIGHPGGGERLVTPESFKADTVGHVTGAPALDEGHLVADLAVLDAGAIGRIDVGELVELSAGYRAQIDQTPGEFEGQPYHQVQRGREYNHVALLPAGAGRAGETVSLRLDAKGNQVTRPDGRQERIDSMKTERIDGVDYDVGTAAWAQARARHEASRQARIDELEEKVADAEEAKANFDEEMSKMKADRDAMKESLDALEKQIADLEDPEKVDARADARAELVQRARRVLGKDADLRGKADLEIMRATLDERDIETDGMSADRVLGRFEGITEAAAAKGDRLDPLHKDRADAFKADGANDDGDDLGDYFGTREAPIFGKDG